ncbi:MAG: molybdopterin-dependent oxidoreductase [Pseudomonadota bacterium]
MKEIKTTCPYCGVGCGVIAAIDSNGAVTIKGDAEHPANFGRLCSKGAALAETIDLDGRLLYPEVNGQRVGWDNALDKVASGLTDIIQQHGPDAVAFYVSGQLLTEDYYVANKLMKGFIGSANIDTNSRLCMSSAVAAYKRAFGSDSVPCSYEDLERAKLVVLVGSNTAWCHPVIYQRLVRAKQENPDLQVVVIDPRRTATCDIADMHLPIKPGSDATLFNGLLSYLAQHGERNVLFTDNYCEGLETALRTAQYTAPSIDVVAEQCALDVEDVEKFFRLFARSERVVTIYSQGINQSSSGTDKANAIINCHLYTGRIGRIGMGPFSVTGQANAMGGREVGGLANQLVAHMDIENPGHRDIVQQFWRSPTIASQGGLKAVDLFRAVEEEKVKAVWVIGTNPVVSMPEADRVKAALQKCELVVVSDVMARTDTLDLAHIKLPALAWGEKSGTVTNSERRISRQRDFLAAPGEARSDWWIISEVARRMGFGEHFDYATPAAVFDEYARLTAYKNNGSRDLNLSGLAGLTEADYDAMAPIQWPLTTSMSSAALAHPCASPIEINRTCGTQRLFGDGKFFTPSGKAQFVAVTPRPPAMPTGESYPMLLNTGRVRDHWHTMTRSGKSPRLATHTQEPFADIHPEDARRLDIGENTLVSVNSEKGKMVVRARLNEKQQPGSLFVPIHWNDQFSHTARVDVLVGAITDPLSGQPEFKHCPVNVEPYHANWYGFLLSRRELSLENASYWSKSRGKGLWRYPIAGRNVPDDWAQRARQLLCTEHCDVGWTEYFDAATRCYRAARLVNGQLESCLYIGPNHELPAHDWLEPLFSKDVISDQERIALLSGRPPVASDDAGPTVCACFGVGRNTLVKKIREEGVASVEGLGAALKAGTNCGSCIPELKGILEQEFHRPDAAKWGT